MILKMPYKLTGAEEYTDCISASFLLYYPKKKYVLITYFVPQA